MSRSELPGQRRAFLKRSEIQIISGIVFSIHHSYERHKSEFEWLQTDLQCVPLYFGTILNRTAMNANAEDWITVYNWL